LPVLQVAVHFYDQSNNLIVQAAAGQQIVAKIDYSNIGTSTASNLVITDAVPQFTTFVSAAVGDSSGISSQPAFGGTGNVVWSVANLVAGGTGQVSLNLLVDSNITSGPMFADSFTTSDYSQGAIIPATQPSLWSVADPGSASKYVVALDPTNSSEQMAQLQSVLPAIQATLSATPGADFSGTFLSTVSSFTGTGALTASFVAPSVNMQDFLTLGDFRVSIDGGNLIMRNSRHFIISQAPAGTWPFNHRMLIDVVYDDLNGIAVANIYSQNGGILTPVLTGRVGDDLVVSPYKFKMWNQAANLGSNGYLYVDDIQLCRGIADKATFATGTVSAVDCAGLHVSCAIPGAIATPTPGGAFAAGLSARHSSPQTTSSSLVSLEKPIVVVPNPAAQSAIAVYDLAESGKVKISLSDVSGAILESWDLGTRPGGVGKRELDLGKFASGVYLVVLHVDSGSGWVSKAPFKLAIVK
jgi:uncharacterized repeat protein (TIGR01451 family)